MKKITKHTASILLLVFGLLSIFLTLSVILDLFDVREKEGNYVLFIVYTNLVCGILYVIAAIQNWYERMMSVYILSLATLVLIVAYIALLIYVANGGIHEAKTPNAMLFRTVFTAVLAGVSFFVTRKHLNKNTNEK